MVDLLDKVFNMGIGALVMTKERAEAMVDELIKKGEVGQEEGKKMVRELLERGERNRHEMRDEMKKIVQDAIKELNLPSRFEIDEMKNDIQLLKESKPNEGELYRIRSEIAQIKAKLNM